MSILNLEHPLTLHLRFLKMYRSALKGKGRKPLIHASMIRNFLPFCMALNSYMEKGMTIRDVLKKCFFLVQREEGEFMHDLYFKCRTESMMEERRDQEMMAIFISEE